MEVGKKKDILFLCQFFYPEYVRYDVDQVENHRMKTDLYYAADGGSYDYYSYDKKDGLNGLLACVDQSIHDWDACFKNTGIIVVERPDGVDKRSGYLSGVYRQDPYDANNLNSSIETELWNLNR